jgi:nuclear-control-of-ATPase protein 2
MWPRLAVIPPVVLIVIRMAYGSREEIGESLVRAVETLKGFWHGYLVEPIRDILDTVRTGGDESARIVNKEGVEANKKVGRLLDCCQSFVSGC